jgi:hypothetical protein
MNTPELVINKVDDGVARRVAETTLGAAVPKLEPEDAKRGVNFTNLYNLLPKCSYSDRKGTSFWSYNLLKRIITFDRIVEELEAESKKSRGRDRLSGQDLPSLAHVILDSNGVSDSQTNSEAHGGYLRIFATLILIAQGVKIADFIKAGVSDRDIPLDRSADGTALCRKKKRGQPLVSFEEQYPVDEFIKRQKEIDIVYLGLDSKGKVRHEVFGSDVMFPWTSYVQKDCGGYATVYRAETPSDCHDFGKVFPAVGMQPPLLSIG